MPRNITAEAISEGTMKNYKSILVMTRQLLKFLGSIPVQ